MNVYRFLIQTGPSTTNQMENWAFLNRPIERPPIFRSSTFYPPESEPSTLDWIRPDHLITSISACILILAMIWVCIIYIKYAIRRDRVLKKIDEIQKGPSETLALLGLTMMVPIAPGNYPTRISKISFFSALRHVFLRSW